MKKVFAKYRRKLFMHRFILYAVIIIVSSLLGGAAYFTYALFYLNSPLELPRTEMHKIPPDVKKRLNEQKASTNLLATIRVPILMYHYVEYVKDKKDTIRQSLDITPNTFEVQLKTLRESGYTFMTAKELADVLDGKRSLPKKPILITFDDGHWDLDTDVLPILKKYQIKATAYIVPGFIGTNSDSLTVAQLEDLIHSGLVEIGAHTVHHVWLKGEPLANVENEVDQSKAMLENTYNIHVYSFAYPYGAFDQQAIDVVKKAGFLTAVSTIPGIEQNQLNRFFLYRIRPGYRTGEDLLNFLQQNSFKPY